MSLGRPTSFPNLQERYTTDHFYRISVESTEPDYPPFRIFLVHSLGDSLIPQVINQGELRPKLPLCFLRCRPPRKSSAARAFRGWLKELGHSFSPFCAFESKYLGT